MINFTFCTPTKVIFGRDIEPEIGAVIKGYGAKHVLIHFGGGSAEKTGLLGRVRMSLAAAGLTFTELGGVEPNPKLSLVHEGIDFCRRERVDFILAVGGGSVIDSAKAIGVGLATGNDPWQYASAGTAPKPREVFPVGVVLTLAAAGSEMSNSCVLTNNLISPPYKQGITAENVRPVVAFMNPENTVTVSPFQTGCGIVDIMMHTMERYFVHATGCDLTDRLAEGLLIAVRDAGRRAIADPCDVEARATLMWASSLSHNDLTGCGKMRLFPVHKMEHPVSALHDEVAHGAGLAVLFPAWAKYVMQHDVMRFAQMAHRVWGVEMDFEDPVRTAAQGIEALKAYFREIAMPVTLGELGLDASDHDAIIAMTTKNGTAEIASYIPLGENEIRDIYKLAE